MTTKERAQFHLNNLLASKVGARQEMQGDRLAWFGFISEPFDHVCSVFSYETEGAALNSAKWAYDWYERQFKSVIDAEEAA
jgi:hypothetical protein